MSDHAPAHDATTDALNSLASLAQRHIFHVDGAAVTLLEPDGDQRGASNAFALAVDEIQYGCGDGPCISAADIGVPMTSGRIGTGETRWPSFVEASSAVTGLRSVLSLPLHGPEHVEGSLNLYSRSRYAFDAVAILQAEMFVRPLTVAIRSARVLSTVDGVAATFSQLLEDRTAVDLAVGVLSATERVPIAAARQLLEESAQSEARPVTEAALALVDQMSNPPSDELAGLGMDIVAALAADLHDLIVDLDQQAYTPGTLAMLQRDLRLAVRSSLGYSLNLVQDGSPPVGVHVIEAPLDLSAVPGSLQAQLERFGPYIGGTITFYASQARAFKDLASDLSGLLTTHPHDLVLDAVLPGGWISPGIAGLTDFSQVNYAVGVLVGHGMSLEDARDELRRRAQNDNTDLPAAARTILYA